MSVVFCRLFFFFTGPDPAPECDPLAPSADDPSCTGPPVAIDRFGKKLYPRKILATEKVFDDPGVGGVYTHITVELCPEESSLTQGIDAGFGDYYRLAVLPDWCSVRDWTPVPGVTYSQMYKCDGARSYSPVNPANVHNAQFIIKVATSGDGSCCECTPNVDCQFGFSEFIQYQKVGDSILMSAVPDHAGTEDSTYVIVFCLFVCLFVCCCCSSSCHRALNFLYFFFPLFSSSSFVSKLYFQPLCLQTQF